MAGHIITRYLRSLGKYEVFDISRSVKMDTTLQLDVRERDHVIKFIEKVRPNFVINCVGILVKDSEEFPDDATYCNSHFPHFLERLGHQYKFRLIHLSTDCVFSGEKGNYCESDEHDGKGLYAKTKSLGEVDNEKDLTIRTSIIGPELKNGTGLFHWFMSQNGNVKGFKRVFWTGLTTLELAKAISHLMEAKITGVYHLVPESKISKFDLLSIIKQVFKKKVNIHPDITYISDKSLVDTRKAIDFKVADYTKMIYELYDYMKHNFLPFYERYLVETIKTASLDKPSLIVDY